MVAVGAFFSPVGGMVTGASLIAVASILEFLRAREVAAGDTISLYQCVDALQDENRQLKERLSAIEQSLTLKGGFNAPPS